MGGCGPLLRALGVSQILVFVGAPRLTRVCSRRHLCVRWEGGDVRGTEGLHKDQAADAEQRLPFLDA
jgi:hypothetical protein